MSPSRDRLTLAECRHWLGSWSSIRSPGHRVLNSTFPASRDAAVTCHTAGMDQGMRVSFIGMSHKGFGAISLQLCWGGFSCSGKAQPEGLYPTAELERHASRVGNKPHGGGAWCMALSLDFPSLPGTRSIVQLLRMQCLCSSFLPPLRPQMHIHHPSLNNGE